MPSPRAGSSPWASPSPWSVGLPSPLALLHMILRQTWLFGAVLSIGAAGLGCVGLMLMKSVQYQVVGATVDLPPPLMKMMSKGIWWVGLLCFVIHSPLANAVLIYFPRESAVLPLSAWQIIFNGVLVKVALKEEFKLSVDGVGTLLCAFSTWLMDWSTPSWMKGAPDVPSDPDLTVYACNNWVFMAYLFVWVVLLASCLAVYNVARPLAIPLLVGLLGSQTRFFGKMSWSLILEGPLTWWTNHEAWLTVIFTAFLFLCTLASTVHGLRLLSCRYFVPATVVAAQVLTVMQFLLFFRAYQKMLLGDVVQFLVSSICAVVGTSFIEPEPNVSGRPSASGEPLIPGNAPARPDPVVRIMDEYNIRKPEPQDGKPLEIVDKNDFRVDYSTCGQKALRCFPIGVTLLLVSLPYLMTFSFDCQFGAFFFLTVFGLYQGWRLSVHMALFSYVGVEKIAHFEKADFAALWQEARGGRRQAASHGGPEWTDLVHIVVLPNYKEDMDNLEETIGSIVRSGIAKDRRILVPAMEESEGEEAHRKAEALVRTYASSFHKVFPTFHPADGRPGEPRGKSANTKYAFDCLVQEFLDPRNGIDPRNVIVTVADAGSDFHAEYFAALSCYFCHAGAADDNETPDRYLTIWQAPVLHFKNYRDQPALVKLASLVAGQYELANLADPNATRVPHSTYSLSAELARKAGVWDADFTSEDWHMALKCFFATEGRMQVSPIFLPVMNYAPVGDGVWKTVWARFVQAALGFGELSYFLRHFWRVWRTIETPKGRALYKWRATLVGVRLLMIHLSMAVFFVIFPLNEYLISYFAQKLGGANTWTFLINCILQSVVLVAFMAVFSISVLLYEAVEPRVKMRGIRKGDYVTVTGDEKALREAHGTIHWDDRMRDAFGATKKVEVCEDGVPTLAVGGKHELVRFPASCVSLQLSMRWRSRGANFVITLVESLVLLLPFAVAAGVAEWIAAVKCACASMPANPRRAAKTSAQSFRHASRLQPQAAPRSVTA